MKLHSQFRIWSNLQNGSLIESTTKSKDKPSLIAVQNSLGIKIKLYMKIKNQSYLVFLVLGFVIGWWEQ